MNDFTKEELETIKKSIDGLMFSKFYSKDTQLVYKKLQSMIDNHCEHKETEMDCDGGISLVCSKCGETVIDI
jgi:hypothetical protein